MRTRFPALYLTEYGNTAFVNARDVKLAFDLDGRIWIPIEMVTEEFVREPTEEDNNVVIRNMFKAVRYPEQDDRRRH